MGFAKSEVGSVAVVAVGDNNLGVHAVLLVVGLGGGDKQGLFGVGVPIGFVYEGVAVYHIDADLFAKCYGGFCFASYDGAYPRLMMACDTVRDCVVFRCVLGVLLAVQSADGSESIFLAGGKYSSMSGVSIGGGAFFAAA